eukprot:TCALIF_01684-PB protein Name:"Similar to trx Histone-lysine N-methyltransferase trithorax (Drosophila virilis)" AED:0.11 eAED:0.18 QI:0/0.63/0.41/0.91/0.90/1/12/267/3483
MGPRAGRQRVRQSYVGKPDSLDAPIEVQEAWELQTRLADGLLVFRGLFNLADLAQDQDFHGFRPPSRPGGPFQDAADWPGPMGEKNQEEGGKGKVRRLQTRVGHAQPTTVRSKRKRTSCDIQTTPISEEFTPPVKSKRSRRSGRDSSRSITPVPRKAAPVSREVTPQTSRASSRTPSNRSASSRSSTPVENQRRSARTPKPKRRDDEIISLTFGQPPAKSFVSADNTSSNAMGFGAPKTSRLFETAATDLIVEGKRQWKPSIKVQEATSFSDLSGNLIKKSITKYADAVAKGASTRELDADNNDEPSDESQSQEMQQKIQRILASQWDSRLRKVDNKFLKTTRVSTDETSSPSSYVKPPLLRKSQLELNQVLLESMRKPSQQVQFYEAIQQSMQNADKTPPKLLSEASNPAGTALVEETSPRKADSEKSTSSPTKQSNRMPGNIVCGICGAVRYYAFILQAKKFGTFSCEPCRKFISKTIRRVTQEQNCEINCVSGKGKCVVPPVIRGSRKKNNGNDVRCQACWLKLCLIGYNLANSLYDQLREHLPKVIQKQLPTADQKKHQDNNPLLPHRGDILEFNRQVPLSRPLFDGFGGDSSNSDQQQLVLKSRISREGNEASGQKKANGSLNNGEIDESSQRAGAGGKSNKSNHVIHERLPNGWTKKAVKRLTGEQIGKWDMYLITPDQKILKSPSDLKLYIAKSGSVIDSNIINFALPKKTAKVDKALKNSAEKTAASSSVGTKISTQKEQIDPNLEKQPQLGSATKSANTVVSTSDPKSESLDGEGPLSMSSPSRSSKRQSKTPLKYVKDLGGFKEAKAKPNRTATSEPASPLDKSVEIDVDKDNSTTTDGFGPSTTHFSGPSARKSLPDITTIGVGTFSIDKDTVRTLSSSGSLADLRFKTCKRTVACKKCENCVKKDCMRCMYCLDRKKHGGKGNLKKVCLERKCEQPVMSGLPAMSTFKSSPDVKRSYVRVATAVATKSAPPPIPPEEDANLSHPYFTPLDESNDPVELMEPTPPDVMENSISDIDSSLEPREPQATSILPSEARPKEESDEKPNLSYAGLIATAIDDLPGKRATLQMIYQYITDRWPFYRTNRSCWQNSIRHNLSLHKEFEKGEKEGKASYWQFAKGADVSDLTSRKHPAREFKQLRDQAQKDTKQVVDGTLPIVNTPLQSSTPQAPISPPMTTAQMTGSIPTSKKATQSLEDFLAIGLDPSTDRNRPIQVLSAIDQEPTNSDQSTTKLDQSSVLPVVDGDIRVPIPPNITQFKLAQPPPTAPSSNCVRRTKEVNTGLGNSISSYSGTMDYWEQYDPLEVGENGQCVITTEDLPVEAICFLCGSAGQEAFIFCHACCEPYHPFCLTMAELPQSAEAEKDWVCRRCAICQICGNPNGQPLRCDQCTKAFHSECLQPNQRNTFGRTDGWTCFQCLRCASCYKSDVSHYLEGSPLCSTCCLQKKQGSFCPLCHGCYDDNDYETRMMECANCGGWVHAKCEGVDAEKYQILSYLPDNVEYVCKCAAPKLIERSSQSGMVVDEPHQVAKNPANSSPLGLLGHTKATPVNQDEQQAPSPLPPFHKEFHTFTTQPLLLNPPERSIGNEVKCFQSSNGEGDEAPWMQAVRAELRAGQIIILDHMCQAKCAKYFMKAKNLSVISQSRSKRSSPVKDALPEKPNVDKEDDVDRVKKALDFGAYGTAKPERKSIPMTKLRKIKARYDLPDCSVQLCSLSTKHQNCQVSNDDVSNDGFSDLDDTDFELLFPELRKCSVLLNDIKHHSWWGDKVRAKLSHAPKHVTKPPSTKVVHEKNPMVSSKPTPKETPIETPPKIKVPTPKKMDESQNTSPSDPPVKVDNDDEVLDLAKVTERLESGLYSSVLRFHLDIKKVVQTVHVPGPAKYLHRNQFKKQYSLIMKEIFPWFDIANPCAHFEPLTIQDMTVKPPYDDHSYANNELKTKKEPHQRVVVVPLNRPSWKRSRIPVKREKDFRRCLMCSQLGDDHPEKAGRLIYYRQNDWNHINCALWSSEVYEEVDGSLQNFSQAVSRGQKLNCTQCWKKGATVGCCYDNCKSNYHFVCGLVDGADFKEDKTMFCRHHKHLYQNQPNCSSFNVQRTVHIDLENETRKKVRPVDLRMVRVFKGSMKISSLGRIIPSSDSQGSLIPVGLNCERWFWSTKNPLKRTLYTCTVRLENCASNSESESFHLTVDHEKDPECSKQIKEFFRDMQRRQVEEERRKSSPILPPGAISHEFQGVHFKDLHPEWFESAECAEDRPEFQEDSQKDEIVEVDNVQKTCRPYRNENLATNSNPARTCSDSAASISKEPEFVSPTKRLNKAVGNVLKRTPIKFLDDDLGLPLDEAFPLESADKDLISAILRDGNFEEELEGPKEALSAQNLPVSGLTKNLHTINLERCPSTGVSSNEIPMRTTEKSDSFMVIRTWFNQNKRKKFSEVSIQCSLPFERSNFEMDFAAQEDQMNFEDDSDGDHSDTGTIQTDFQDQTPFDDEDSEEGNVDMLSYVAETMEKMNKSAEGVEDEISDLDILNKILALSGDKIFEIGEDEQTFELDQFSDTHAHSRAGQHSQDLKEFENVDFIKQKLETESNVSQLDGSDEPEGMIASGSGEHMDHSGDPDSDSPRKDFSIAGLLSPTSGDLGHLTTPEMATSYAETYQQSTGRNLQYVTRFNGIQGYPTMSPIPGYSMPGMHGSSAPALGGQAVLQQFPGTNYPHMSPYLPQNGAQILAQPGFVQPSPHLSYITPQGIIVNPQPSYINIANPYQGGAILYPASGQPAPMPGVVTPHLTSTSFAVTCFSNFHAPVPSNTITTNVTMAALPTTSSIQASTPQKKIARVQPQPSVKLSKSNSSTKTTSSSRPITGLSNRASTSSSGFTHNSSRMDPIKALSSMASQPMASASMSAPSEGKMSISHNQKQKSSSADGVPKSGLDNNPPMASTDLSEVEQLPQRSPSLVAHRKHRALPETQRSVGIQAKIGAPLKILTPRPWHGSETSGDRPISRPSAGSSSVLDNNAIGGASSVIDPNRPQSVESTPIESQSNSPKSLDDDSSSEVSSENCARVVTSTGVHILTQPSKSNAIKIVLQRNKLDEAYKIQEMAIKDGSKVPNVIEPETAIKALKIKAKVSRRTKLQKQAAFVSCLDGQGQVAHTEEEFVNEQTLDENGERLSGLEHESLWKPVELNQDSIQSGPHLIYELSSDDGFFKAASHDPSEIWRKVFDAVQDARIQQSLTPMPHNPLGQTGLQMLGLTHSALAFLLEQLPGAKSTDHYQHKHHRQEEETLKENPSGSARTEQFKNRSPLDMFSWLASRHRQVPLPKRKENKKSEIELSSNRRATSLDLPMAMRFRHLAKNAKEAVGVYRSGIHGRGLYCKREIKTGEMVIEYAGEEIRAMLTDKREKYYESRGIGCYMFKIDDDTVVDATMRGNAARFINHSCDPNCFSKIVDILGKKHIIIFALRKIFPGEELTYDYKFPIEDVKLPCSCGAKKCRKYMN